MTLESFRRLRSGPQQPLPSEKISDRNQFQCILSSQVLDPPRSKGSSPLHKNPCPEKIRDPVLNQFYQLQKHLGKGTFASVNEGICRVTGNRVAIKSFNNFQMKSFSAQKLMANEAAILEKVSHKNIVRLVDRVKSDRFTHLVLNLSQGTSLSQFSKSFPNKALPEALAKTVFKQILLGINYLHSNNVYHRDLKPANVMVKCGKDLRVEEVFIIDFGFALQQPANSFVSDYCGTPNYMAPEIVQKMKYRPESTDVWAFGVMLYKTTTGIYPFSASGGETL